MRKFGLIGYPLSHSFSQKFFTEKFLKENIKDCVYENYPLESIREVSSLIKSEKELYGLNITIPYKEQIIPFLDSQDPVVGKTGACNCIKIGEGKCFGYNTDVVGFKNSLIKKLQPAHTHALILGTGGASKAVRYVLDELGIIYKLVSRRPPPNTKQLSYGDLDKPIMESYLLVINTSPLGMYPQVGSFPPLPYQLIHSRHYLFDLVYNPAKTIFLQKGEAQGAVIENGQEMLIIQAEESWKIWNE
jgi:shikimate dehydrogenase